MKSESTGFLSWKRKDAVFAASPSWFHDSSVIDVTASRMSVWSWWRYHMQTSDSVYWRTLHGFRFWKRQKTQNTCWGRPTCQWLRIYQNVQSEQWERSQMWWIRFSLDMIPTFRISKQFTKHVSEKNRKIHLPYPWAFFDTFWGVWVTWKAHVRTYCHSKKWATTVDWPKLW